MSEVAFHFNVPEPGPYICRLLRKVVRTGHRVAVLGEEGALDELDKALWCLDPTSFFAHSACGAPAWVADQSPVVLMGSLGSAQGATVLLNLGLDLQPGFDAYPRIVEVIGAGEVQRRAARVRWKQYQQQGHRVTGHEFREQGGR